jgi:hypothetical protein
MARLGVGETRKKRERRERKEREEREREEREREEREEREERDRRERRERERERRERERRERERERERHVLLETPLPVRTCTAWPLSKARLASVGLAENPFSDFEPKKKWSLRKTPPKDFS